MTTPVLPETDLQSLVASMQACVALGDAGAALDIAEATLAVHPEALEILLVQAAVLDDLGRVGEARAALEHAAAHHGDVAAVWPRLGDVALEGGDAERAIEAYRQWQRLDGPSAENETALALAHFVDLDVERARRHLDGAVAAGGSDVATALADDLAAVDGGADLDARAGWWCCQYGAIDRGVELLRGSLARHDDPTTRHHLGQALFRQGRVDDAVVELRAAVELAPGELGWRNELGTAQLAAHDLDGAAASFEAVLGDAPGDVAARIGSARVSLARGDSDAALAVAEELVQADPTVSDAWMLRAESQLAAGCGAEALVSAEHAVVAAPDERRPWLLAADAADAAGWTSVAQRYRGRGSIVLTGSIGVAEGGEAGTLVDDVPAELHELDRIVVADPRVRPVYAHRAVIADRLFLPARALAYLDAAIERGVVEVTPDVERDRAALRAAIGEGGAAGVAATAPAPRADGFVATHRVPPVGLAAYADPTREQPPTARLDPGLPVQLVEQRAAWAHVRFENGWECWVDAKLLVPEGGPWSPTHRVPASGLIAYAAPSPTPRQVGRIDPGLDVELISDYGGWAHVRFENEWTCWVNRNALEATT